MILNNKPLVFLLFLFLFYRHTYFYGGSNNRLKEMFQNPINLNTASDNDIKTRLTHLRFPKIKIRLLLTFLKYKKSVVQYDLFVTEGILSREEALILSRFFFLSDDDRFHIFESNLESEYSTEDDRVNDSNLIINLNRFKKEKLLSLTFISKKEVQAIIRYRKKIRYYSSIYQLLLIPEISRKTFVRLKPHLKRLKGDISDFPNSVEFRYRIKYEPYNPDPKKKSYFYTKMNLELDKGLELKIAGIKKDTQKGYYPGSIVSNDFQSFQFYRQFSLAFYIEREESGISLLAIGDYSLRFGQHLVFGSSFPPFLDKIDKHPIKKRDYGIRRYTNPNRLGALRGIAFSVPMGQFELTPFVFVNEYELAKNRFTNDEVNISLERLITDSSVIVDDINMGESLLESGGGFNLIFKRDDRLKLGLNFVYTEFSDLLNPPISDSEDEKLFRGDQLYLSSIYFDWWITRKFNLYGETAFSVYEDTVLINKTIIDVGTVLGGILDLSSFKYSFLIRYLGDQFNSPYASSVIDERKNEMGLFQGLFFRFYRNFHITLYFDLFKPLDKTSFSKRFSTKLSYKVMPDLLIIYIFTITYKPYFTTYRTRIKNQGTLEYWFLKDFSYRLRYEKISSKRENQSDPHYGNLFYNQLKYRFLGFLTAILRITVYQADDFDAAVFALGNQLLYWYNGIDSFSNEGIKYDFILKSRHKRLILGLKFTLDDRKNKRERDVDEKLFLQLIYKW